MSCPIADFRALLTFSSEARDPGYYGGGGGGYGCTAGRGYSTYGGCIDCGANTYSPGAYSQCIGCPAWSTSGLVSLVLFMLSAFNGFL